MEIFQVKNFRHLKDLTLNFGEKLTAIAGQNGTGKSSILGLAAHIFTFPQDYKTLNEKPYTTLFSEIFKFSYPDYDKPKEHDYIVELDTGERIPVLSYDRKEKSGSSLRLRVGKSKKDVNKVTFPVIYLGLRRLFPLAQEEKVKHDGGKLNADLTLEYQSLHNEILLLNEKIDPEYVDAMSKSFYAIKTDKYDCLGNSAGQDNIGQILTALLSFKKLKETMRDTYPGGILLIDELDATLYPAAQIKLVEKLFRMAQDLDLQIIFTTHSTDVVETMMDSKYRHHSKVIYLTGDTGEIKNVQDEITIDKIINNLKVQLPTRAKTEKIIVFCEDNEAKAWVCNLLGNTITKNLLFINDSFGAGNLVDIANKKIPVFKRCIFVLDGDKNAALRNNKCPRVILLPGQKRPEDIFHKFLHDLLPGDKFWGRTGEYTKQYCFRDRPAIHQDRVVMKQWFNNQKEHWGRGGSKLFKRWKEENSATATQFRTDFENLIRQMTN